MENKTINFDNNSKSNKEKYYVILEEREANLEYAGTIWNKPKQNAPGRWIQDTWIFLSSLRDILADYSSILGVMFNENKSLLYRAEHKGEPNLARFDYPKEYYPSVGTMLYHHTGDTKGLHNVVKEARLLYQVTEWSKSNLRKFSSDCLIRGYKKLKANSETNPPKCILEIINFLQIPNDKYMMDIEGKFESQEDHHEWKKQYELQTKLLDEIKRSQERFDNEWWHLLNSAKMALNDFSFDRHLDAAKSIRFAISLNYLRNDKGYLNKEIVKKENTYVISKMNLELNWQAEHLEYILGE